MNSKMDVVYVHLANSDVPDVQRFTMEQLGVAEDNLARQKQEEENAKTVVVCRRCSFANVIGARYCNRCAYCLDDNVLAESLIKTK